MLYELHVGTFTAEGTFEAAAARLPALAELGITHVELMPIAEFPGHHGWGYDGVYLSAAHSAYGGPHGLARFVDAAHAAGLGVILDVVYNHVGASGVKALEAFGPFFTERHETPWGKAVNFDGEDSDGVREWVLQSATGWVRDFHVDGLRLDAIHAIHDDGARHVLRELAERVRAENRRALVIAESGLNDPKVIRPPRQGGYGHDAVWADDFHHALRALLTGERSGWYEEFGQVAQLAKAFHRPHVHDGGYSTFRRRRFGARADDRAPEQFVVFGQNHDQVGNRAFGDRLPARGAAAGRVLHAAGTLHPHAVHGRGARRACSVSVLLRSHRQAHGRRDPRGPPPGVRRLRRVRRRGGARSAGSGHLRALQAHAPREHEAARAVRRAAARAPRAAARRGQHRVLRGRRLAARAPRRLRAGVQLRGGPADGAGARGARWRSPPTARPSATAACACPRARER